MTSIKERIKLIKKLLRPIYPEAALESCSKSLKFINKENKVLRKRLSIELKKSRARERNLKELRKDNFNLSRQIQDINNRERRFYI